MATTPAEALATIPKKPAADSAPNDNGWKPELHDVALDAIELGGNVRSPDALDVKELAASIAANGVRSPIRVADIGAGRYELIYGQRRVAAARLAGLVTIPAVVDAEQPAREDRAVDQLLENLQREDLNALDTAKAYRWLLDKGLTQRALGERLGIAQPTIANALALLKAPDEIQARVAAGELTRSHVEAIVKLPKAEQAEVARRVVELKLSTRQVEEEIGLAARRAAQADQSRDERRALADKTEAALAKKRGVTKETVTLFSYDGQLAHELKQRGWTVLDERPGYYGAPKGCDCPAWSISRNYMGGRQDSVTLAAQCVEPAHVKAANDADAEERAKRQAENEAKQAAEREKQAVAITAMMEQLSADPELRARVVLWGLLDYGSPYSSWAEVVALPLAEVECAALAELARVVLDAPDVLATVSKPAAKSKPAKAKKA